MTTAARVIAQARMDLGMTEDPPGSNVCPITKEFGKIPGYPHGGYGYPWCAAATSVWCRRVGLKPNTDYPHTASTLEQHRWAVNNNRLYKTPKPGDLVLYTSNGAASGIYHVELVESVSASSITTIGGNTRGYDASGKIHGEGNGCYRKTVSRANSAIFGYVRPRYTGAKEEPAVPWDGKSYPGHYVRRGDRGAEVKWVQTRLNVHGYKLDVDADFGPLTESAVRAFQKAQRLEVDGIVGPQTWAALAKSPTVKSSGPSKILQLGDRGAEVRKVRDRLIKLGYTYLKPGDKWGKLQTVAVMDFQARNRLEVDGLVGPQTWKALGL